jgi:cytochrome c553
MKTLITISLSLILATGQVLAAGDPAAGEAKAASCTFCHNVDGNSLDPAIPKLAGQHEKYILQQSLLFHSGKRQDASMQGVTAVINDKQELADIAAYFAAQSPMASPPGNSRAEQKGKLLYTGMLKCNQCHGDHGEGSPGNDTAEATPRLAGQHKAYLIRTLQEFRSNQRKSTNGYMMNTIMPMVSDKEIELMAEYLSQIDTAASEDTEAVESP